MSKLAHSNQPTMDEIEVGRMSVGFPTALTIIKAIAGADGILCGGEGYLTKYQMITLCKVWLAKTRARAGFKYEPGKS